MELRMPVLSDADVQQVAAMILRMHSPEAIADSTIAKSVEKELLSLQQRDEAWGLTEGLMRYEDPVVRFFGAQNAQVKISRDWDTLPPSLHPPLLKQLLDLTSDAASPTGRYAQAQNGIVLRKLFSSLASLIIRLTPSTFSSPLMTVTNTLAGHNVPRSTILEWLTVSIRDLTRAAIVEPRKSQLANAINEEVPLVLRTITDALSGQGGGDKEKEARAAFECLDSWIEWGLGSDEILNILPTLYALLSTALMPQAIESITEILTVSIFRDGKATKALTEPILDWLSGAGWEVVQIAIQENDANGENIIAIRKLVSSLIDHSATWMASRMDQPRVQAFLRVLLALTGFPGIGSVEEEISEQTLIHYSEIQEALTEAPEFQESYETSTAWGIARDFFQVAVSTVNRKIRWPDEMDGNGSRKEDREKFEVYRRDAGEVLVTAYYVLRQDMLGNLKDQLIAQLHDTKTSWQDIEATLYCITSASEAVPLGEDIHLPIIFSAAVFDRLPAGPSLEVSHMALRLIESYEEWFKYHPSCVTFVLNYVVSAIETPALASLGARVLKALCDLCRSELKQHVEAFGVLHGRVSLLQPLDQVRVIEAITSILQALPPAESVQPVTSIVTPIADKLQMCLGAASQAREAARNICIQQIQSLTACGKGLTPPEEDMFDLDPDATVAISKAVEETRQIPELQHLRERILAAIRGVMETWPTDTEVGDTLSAFMKAMTASPTTQTIVSLPAAPLLQMVGSVAEATSSAIWPAIASILIFRMAPAPGLRKQPINGALDPIRQQAIETVAQTASVLIRRTATIIVNKEDITHHPDIAESYFDFACAVMTKFPSAMLLQSPNVQNAAMHLAVIGLMAQERFTLKAAIDFLVSVLNTSRHAPAIADSFLPLIMAAGPDFIQATIAGAGLYSPRSTIPNFAELLVASVVRIPNETRDWVVQALSQPSFPGGKETPEAKKKFQDMVLKTRTPKKMREALHDFALVCRGLADTTYGSATSM